jgi:hypothetical protein
MFVGEKTLAHLNGRFLPGVNHWALFPGARFWFWARIEGVDKSGPGIGRVDYIVNFCMAGHAQRASASIGRRD